MFKHLLSSAAMAIVGLGMAFQASAVETGVELQLQLKDTDLFLSVETSKAGSSSEATQQEADAAGFCQTFIFEENGSAYNIKTGDGTYLVRDQWYVHYMNADASKLSGNDAKWAVEEDGDYIKIKNLGTNKYIGRDNVGAGSKVYADKSGDKVCLWAVGGLTLEAYVEQLNKTIAEAENLLATTVEGDEENQYPASARAALQSAIDSAKSALSGDIDAVKAAKAALAEAIAKYKGAKVPAVFGEGFYKFQFKPLPGVYMASGWHANSWESGNVESIGLLLSEEWEPYNFVFQISRTTDDYDVQGYTIRDSDGHYMYNCDGKFRYAEEEYNDHSKADEVFLFEEADGGWYTIKSASTGKYVGPNDNTAGWEWIHLGTNHTGASQGNLFMPELQGRDVTGMITEKIAEAEKLLADTEEGDDEGQYSAYARNELTAAISNAKAAVESGDAETIDAAYYQLVSAIQTYTLNINPAPFRPGVYRLGYPAIANAYFCSGWHANSWETGNLELTGLILTEDESAGYNMNFTIERTPEDAQAQGYYIIDQDGNHMYNKDGKLYYSEFDASINPLAKEAVFLFEPSGAYYTITNVGSGKYVGPIDGTEGWSWIHLGTKHDGSNRGNLFDPEFLEEVAIDAVESDSEISIAATAGRVTVAGATEATVYTLSGATAATATSADGNLTLTLPAGVYVVRAASATATTAAKVIVK